MNVLLQVKRKILNDKLQLWQNTYFSWQVDTQIAQDIGDDQMLQQTKEHMKRCLRAIRVLEDALTKLELAKSNGDNIATDITLPE